MKFIKLLTATLALLSTTLCNAQWTQLTIPASTASMRTAYFKDANNGFVAGAERIRKTTNAGASWDTCNYGIYWAYLNGCIIENIHFVSATEGIAAGWVFWDNCEIVFKTHDGGNTWTDIRWGNGQAAFGTYLYDMHFPTTTTGYCVGDLGHIIKSTDGGDNWAYVSSGTTNGLKGVCFTSASNGIVVGDEVILKTTNGGTSWTSQSYTGVYFTDVTFTNATTGYAVASDAVYKTTDGGNTWNVVNANVGGEDITAVNSDTIFIASGAGVFKSNNAGTQFLQQPSLYPDVNFYGIYFYNSTLGFAMNYDGKVFKTTTAGDMVQQNDAGVTAIQSLPFGSCQGVQPVDIRIKNFGQSNLTQATINWKVNGVAQTPFVWNGNLAFDSVSAPFTIGSYNFPGGNSDIVAFTTQANSQIDHIHYNDTTASTYSFPRLRGIYTIGGTNPHYTTIDAAITALNNYGTCGNVEFKIRNGTYQPAFSWNIANFFKNSATDSVAFNSESGDSSQVILQGYNTNFGITKAGKITFSKLTFQNTNSGTMLQLNDSTTNIAVQNCVFLAPASGSSIAHSGKACVNIFVKNCRFLGGGIGITSINGTEISDGISITKCVFDSIANTGISITFAKNILIQENTMNGIAANPISGITLTTCNYGFLIDRNKIFTHNAYNLLYLSGCQDTMGTEGVVSNNFFGGNLTSTTLSSFIHMFNCLRINFIYNTVNCSNDFAVRIYQGDTLKWPQHTFINNIICNRRNDVIFDWGIPSVTSNFYLSKVFKEIGHNAYFNLPGVSGYYPYRFFSGGDFNDWKGYYPSDSTSVFVNPQFASYMDYHITPKTSNILINNKGKSIAGYTTDIDNITRGGAPDIGCSEFSLKTVDAGVKSFLASTRICSGVSSVDVRVGNFGLNNITSGTINWSVNGTSQTAYSWSGNISSGDSSALISIGTYNFVVGNTYTIHAWMSNANSSADVNHINDTSSINVTSKGLSGIYTIGGVSPSYATFSAAVADLILNGVCSPVTFNVRNGIYQDSIPLTPVAGASALNTITFQSETGDSTAVTLWNVGRKVVRLDTAAYITFHQMTIVDSTLGTSQAAFYCIGTPHHINIKNCIIRSNSGGYSVRNDGKVITDFIFDNNIFSGGNSAINMSFGGLGFYLCKNITITNNRFQSKNATIISIARGANVLIDKNYFHSYLYFNPSGVYAIQLTGGVTSKITVTNNVIDLRNYNQCINYSGNGQPYDKSLFANNMVSAIGPAAGSCFWFQSSKNVRVAYNSAIADSGNASATVFYAPDAGSEIFNNSFYNKGSGSAAYFNGTGYLSNHNNFYAETALPVETFSNNYTLSGWQSLSGMDANSYSGNPYYISQINLHSTGSYNLNGNGIALTDVTKDIDGDVRSATPDIGADEFPFILQANDAGVKDVENPDTLCAGVHPIKVRIRNFGSAALTSATVNWSVNGVVQTPYVWSGSLTSLSISNYFSIGNYTFGALDTFDIVAWTTNPNGLSDGAAVNDTSKLPGILTRMQGVYTIGGTNPDFATFVIALQKIKSIGICGPVTFNLRNGTHQGPSNNINSFIGLSATNTWTIQSESGDSNAVIIDNNNSSGTLYFNGVDYVTIKNLTVNTWASYDGIRFDNGSDYCKVQGCILNARLTVYYNCHHNILENNLIYERIYLYAQSSAQKDYGTIVRNNTIINNYGIYSYQHDSLLIENNTITNPNTFSTGGNYGINLLGNNTVFKCVKNRITGNFGSALDISQSGTANDTCIIANNIYVAGNIGGCGIQVHGQYYKVVYNTFYYPPGSGGNPIQYVGMPFDLGTIVKNNQFVTYGYDWACYWGQIGGSTHTVSDYNNYFTSGTDLISVGISTQYQTIAGFNAAYPSYDPNSTDVDPQFQSPNFLYPTNNAALNTGTPVYGVIDDINGLLRDAANPTMGALEAPPVFVDDSINKDVAIQLLNTNLSLGNNTISVQVNNLKPFLVDTVFHNFMGTVDTLYLSYSVNGAAPVNETWIGSLAINDTIIFNFSQQYNVPKGRLYTVLVQVTLPSSYNTLALQNDTVTYEIGLPMAGVYTVGGSNPDFINLDDANYNVRIIHTSGDVTFNIRNGLDSIWSIYEYQDPYFITYQSETGNAADVQIVFSVSYDSYRINFKNVTIYPKTNTGYLYNYKGAEFIGGQISLDNCIIQGLNDPLYRNGITFVHTDSLSVTNCHFIDLDNGITLSDYTWFGMNYFWGNNYFINNSFDSVSNCIRLLGHFAGDSIYIAKNTMNSPILGIEYKPDSYGSKLVVEKNKITEASSYSLFTGSPFSFSVYSVSISNNMLGGNVQMSYYDNDTVNFNYNSVLGTVTMNDSRNVNMRNNSFYSTTANPAIVYNQFLSGSTNYNSDYNNFYAPNALSFANYYVSGLGYYNATTIAGLNAYIGAENNSINKDPHYFSTTDFHSNAPSLNNKGTPLAFIPTDIDEEPRSVTLPDIGCDEFNVADSLVWPGDCNYDGTANNYDLLSIGLYFNQTGTTRAGASNTWVGQASADWGTLQYCGYDKKHADSNGDGIITWSDTTAIKLNWGQTHPFKPLPIPYNSLVNDLHFVSSATAYKPGDTVDVEIWAGDISNPVAALYGISFDIAFPSSMVQAGSMTLTYNPSWIGVENVTAITTANIGVTAAGSIVRNTGTDTSGYGMFAKLHFIVEPTLTSVSDFTLNFSNYLALTANGNLVQFNTVSDTLTIDPTLSIEENASQHFFNLYPNPATDETTISYVLPSLSQIKIELYNSIGEKIKVLKDEKQQAGNHQLKINLSNKTYSKGIYFVKMMVDGNVYAKKLLLE